jgi:hypothetical protein
LRTNLCRERLDLDWRLHREIGTQPASVAFPVGQCSGHIAPRGENLHVSAGVPRTVRVQGHQPVRPPFGRSPIAGRGGVLDEMFEHLTILPSQLGTMVLEPLIEVDRTLQGEAIRQRASVPRGRLLRVPVSDGG